MAEKKKAKPAKASEKRETDRRVSRKLSRGKVS